MKDAAFYLAIVLIYLAGTYADDRESERCFKAGHTYQRRGCSPSVCVP